MHVPYFLRPSTSGVLERMPSSEVVLEYIMSHRGDVGFLLVLSSAS